MIEPRKGFLQDILPIGLKRSMETYKILPEAELDPGLTQVPTMFGTGVDWENPLSFIGEEATAKARELGGGERFFGARKGPEVVGRAGEIWTNEGEIKKAWSESKPITIEGVGEIDPKAFETLDDFRKFFVTHEFNHNMGILDELLASKTPRTNKELRANMELVRKLKDIPENVNKMIFGEAGKEETRSPFEFLQRQQEAPMPEVDPIQPMSDINAMNQEAMTPFESVVPPLQLEYTGKGLELPVPFIEEKPTSKKIIKARKALEKDQARVAKMQANIETNPLPIIPKPKSSQQLLKENLVNADLKPVTAFTQQIGGLKPKSKVAKGESETRPKLPFLKSGKLGDDQVAQAAYDQGLLPENTVTSLHRALEMETKSQTESNLRSEKTFMEDERLSSWEKTEAEKITPKQLKKGDSFSVMGEQLSVIDDEGTVKSGETGEEFQMFDPADTGFQFSIDKNSLRGPDVLRFAKEGKKQERGFLETIVKAPKDFINSALSVLSKPMQALIGKQSENFINNASEQVGRIKDKMFDGKSAEQIFDGLKRNMAVNIAENLELKKMFGRITELYENLDLSAEPDFTSDGASWIRGIKKARTPLGQEMQSAILDVTKKLGKENYRYTGEGDYARQMLVTNDMDVLVIDSLEGLSPSAQKGFVTMFKPERKMSDAEKGFRDKFLEEVSEDPIRAQQLEKVREYFEGMNQKAHTALSDPNIVQNDPNAIEFANLPENKLSGRLNRQTYELVKSIWLKQMEPSQRIDLEKEFRPGIEQRRSFFFHPDYLEKDSGRLLQSWMSQHEMLQKAPIYKELTEFITKGPGQGMEGGREILKNIQQDTMPQIVRGKPNILTTTADKLFGWDTNSAVNPTTELVMKSMKTLYQQFLGTPRFALLNSSDAFVKAAMLLAEKGANINDMAAVGKIVGKSLYGDKFLNKVIDDFFVSGEPSAFEFSRISDLPRKGDKGVIPELMQKVPFLYEGLYGGIRKAQTSIIKRSENFSDKVAFLSNLELELRKQGKTLQDIYKIPEDAQKELVGRVIDDTMKLQNKYAGVLNKSSFGYRTQGAYGSPEYVAMALGGMFSKYPINFINELIKRQAASKRLLYGPMMAFSLAMGGTFGTYSLLTSKEKKDIMGKMGVLIKAPMRAVTQIKPGSLPLGIIKDVLEFNPAGMAAPVVPGLPALNQFGKAFNFIGGKQ